MNVKQNLEKCIHGIDNLSLKQKLKLKLELIGGFFAVLRQK